MEFAGFKKQGWIKILSLAEMTTDQWILVGYIEGEKWKNKYKLEMKRKYCDMHNEYNG